MKNTDQYINIPNINKLLADFGDNKIYDINISETINNYDSELLEKYNGDILKSLNSLSEDVLKQYILTSDILYELAFHLLDYEVYKDEDGTQYLELSSDRVFNEVNIEILQEEIINEARGWLNSYENEIKEKYSNTLKILQLGRSGRHICIPLSIEGIIIYNTLVKEYNRLEKEFINYINYNGDNDDD